MNHVCRSPGLPLRKPLLLPLQYESLIVLCHCGPGMRLSCAPEALCDGFGLAECFRRGFGEEEVGGLKRKPGGSWEHEGWMIEHGNRQKPHKNVTCAAYKFML